MQVIIVVIIITIVIIYYYYYSGHKSAVTCLQFNSTGTQLVSGSKDTHIVLWDLVAEAGVVR